MTNELKPVRCGCGGEAVLETDHDTIQPVAPIDWKRVRCNKCNIRTTWRRSEASAITAWNKAMGERTAKVTQIETDSSTVFLWKCNNCGQPMHKTSWSRQVNYCPSCGAKLDWGKDE